MAVVLENSGSKKIVNQVLLKNTKKREGFPFKYFCVTIVVSDSPIVDMLFCLKLWCYAAYYCKVNERTYSSNKVVEMSEQPKVNK